MSREEVLYQIPFTKVGTLRADHDMHGWFVQVGFNNVSSSPWVADYALIYCNSQQQAAELAVKIREAI